MDPTNATAIRHKENFLKVQQITLMGSSADDIIRPWDSSLFNFYDPSSPEDVSDMTKHNIYIDDTFGLRTMDERGSLKRIPVDGIAHTDWLDTDAGVNAILEQL
mmetsp:Transcript_41229/g.106639  ORF Transcript_41229/g.106639 Transcript_41229/m.106639 type:complete len:104 (-) Transcript_41229:881-1192(-)